MVNISYFTWLYLLPLGLLTKSEFVWKDWMQKLQHMINIKNIYFFDIKIWFCYKNNFLSSFIAGKSVNRKLRFLLASKQSMVRRHVSLWSGFNYFELRLKIWDLNVNIHSSKVFGYTFMKVFIKCVCVLYPGIT